MSAVFGWHGETAVVTVSGEVDMVTAPRLHAVLSDALGQEPAALVVDLSSVGFLASAGLSTLVAGHQQAGAKTVLRVVATSSATVRPLQVTALDREIAVFRTVEEAVHGR